MRLLALVLGVLCFQVSARAEDSPSHRALGEDGEMQLAFVTVEGHLSLLTDLADQSLVDGTWGYAFRGGYRFNNWGVYGHVEQNFWLATELDTEVVQGAVSVGVGFERFYRRGFVRTALALGVAIMVFDTALDERGSTGLFLDLRPLGVRWPVARRVAVGFDPLHFTVVAPVLDSIPLVQVEYRTSLYLEVVLG